MPTNRELYLLFENLFREHYDALAQYAFSILKSKEDAEDIVQDVFVKLWQNTPEVIETAQVKFYLLTAVKNNSISLLRKQAGKHFVDAQEADLQALPESSKDATQDIAALVERALTLLPPQCSVIFKMSRFGKLTYQQIATELNLSVKTVENQIGKALRLMRDYAREHNISFSLLILLLFGQTG